MADTKVVPPSEGKAKDFVSLPAGTIVGRYTVTAVLGQGTFGITYRARDDQLGRDVAIKEYLPTAFAVRHDGLSVLPNSTKSGADFAWGRQRFVEEGRTLAGFDQAPGIVRVYDFLEANGTAYIVMELVRGETLEHKLKGGGLSPEAIDRLLQPLLRGLAKVHEAGFVHRDIKPANILIDDEGRPTLVDFGAARAAMAGRTAAMTAVFTPGYAAVEQFTDARQGPWTDIYGLSATLYHAISGKMPPSAIDRMIEDRCVPLATLRPPGFVPATLAGVDRGLAIRADSRPQSIAAWGAVFSPGVSVSATGGRPGRAAAWGALAVLLLAVAAGGLYGALRPAPSPPSATAEPIKAGGVEASPTQRREAEATAAERLQTEQEAQRKLAAEQQQRRDEMATRQRAEEEARQKAEAEREAARRQADEEAQRRFEAESAARQKVEVEARQRAAAEQAASQKAEEEARDKAAADEATRQKAAVEQAASQKAEEEARDKAAADEAAQRKAEEQTAARAKAELEREKKAAEAAEAALRLAPLDRQRLQAALTSLGFDTRGTDGVFGPRSREMVAAWQKARNLPSTGFLDGAHQQRLLKEAEVAVARFDEEQARIAEEKTKSEEVAKRAADEEARRKAQQAATAASPIAGRWYGVIGNYTAGEPRRFLTVTIMANNPVCTWDEVDRTSGYPAKCTIDANRLDILTGPGSRVALTLNGGSLAGSFTLKDGRSFTLSMQRASADASRPQPGADAAITTSVVPDGTYSGGFNAPSEIASVSGLSFVARVRVQLKNGRGSGSIVSRSRDPIFIEVAPNGQIDGKGQVTTYTGSTIPLQIRGRVDGDRLQLNLTGLRAAVAVTLSKE